MLSVTESVIWKQSEIVTAAYSILLYFLYTKNFLMHNYWKECAHRIQIFKKSIFSLFYAIINWMRLTFIV
jgi:hypothetical protein